VKRIIDGDTFETQDGEKVRLIGINAPEISDIYGRESKQHLAYLIDAKIVEMYSDNISNDKDVYKRLLRYISVDGVDINMKMVNEGFAFAYLKYNFTKSEEYKQAQTQAQLGNRGIWGNDKETTAKKEHTGSYVWKEFSPKSYLIGSMVLILIIIGLYYYIKK